MSNSEIITAGEIGEFVFCKRAWWLRKNGLLPENEAMTEGTIRHEKLADSLSKIKLYLILAIAVIILGVLLLLLFFTLQTL